MAGRPRAMIRRIKEWKQQANKLHKDIRIFIPAQYRDHRLNNSENFRYAGEREQALADLLKRDPVAYGWIEIQHHVRMLAEELQELGTNIRTRALRNGIPIEEPSLDGSLDEKWVADTPANNPNLGSLQLVEEMKG